MAWPRRGWPQYRENGIWLSFFPDRENTENLRKFRKTGNLDNRGKKWINFRFQFRFKFEVENLILIAGVIELFFCMQITQGKFCNHRENRKFCNHRENTENLIVTWAWPCKTWRKTFRTYVSKWLKFTPVHYFRCFHYMSNVICLHDCVVRLVGGEVRRFDPEGDRTTDGAVQPVRWLAEDYLIIHCKYKGSSPVFKLG